MSQKRISTFFPPTSKRPCQTLKPAKVLVQDKKSPLTQEKKDWCQSHIWKLRSMRLYRLYRQAQHAHLPSSPPPKRRAIQTAVPSDEGPEPTEDRLVAVERACQSALAEQKAEYIHLHQTLLTNQATMQATIESIRAELHKTIADLATALGVSVAPQAIPQPMFDLTHDPNQSQ
ncbi:hypothetical protein HPB48_011109 [Haemaphysalis longicornis]|uniref:Uncharacterized protein n=1 Tax=Haemaphysalis longicornis TaxID=44386 RepID=A0A9J6FX78_HAELO|nr:hypothetical protein HPB48_011109 [Haemaphysalis longicornis]